jgi:hypothetical protein
MFLRSMVITTPLDQLWVRMPSRSLGDEEETKWMNEINQSIQQLQRSTYIYRYKLSYI